MCEALCILSRCGRLCGETWSSLSLSSSSFAPSSLCPASVIDALDMESMANTVRGWQENPVKFARSHGVSLSPEDDEADAEDTGIHILIVEGFLIYNYK